MIRFPCASKAALSCRSSLTNAAIRLASRSSCCSKKIERSEVSTFRIVIETELFILYFLPNEDFGLDRVSHEALLVRQVVQMFLIGGRRRLFAAVNDLWIERDRTDPGDALLIL